MRHLACTMAFGRAGILLAILPCLAGCGVSELQDEYGQRNGPAVYASVNGTAVFAQMCQDRGHSVFSWPVLSPRLQDRADCIVWFPDDFDPPKRDARRWLERWLKAKPGRTLIYVGRHFDAEPWYWENVATAGASAEQQAEIGRRRKAARTAFAAQFTSLRKSAQCDWFEQRGQYGHRAVQSLAGEAEWVDSVDPSKLQMELNSRLVPPPSADVLLESEGDALVFARAVRQSRMIVVANGSFLLNAPLTNHQHRRLASKLIDQIGPPEQRIAFLESTAGGPEISDSDPSFGPQLGFEMFHIWPANWILIHACLVGILLCYCRFPIFGRPVELESQATSDFGTHIDAVARLLKRSGDIAFAHARLQHYRQTVHPEPPASSGTLHKPHVSDRQQVGEEGREEPPAAQGQLE